MDKSMKFNPGELVKAGFSTPQPQKSIEYTLQQIQKKIDAGEDFKGLLDNFFVELSLVPVLLQNKYLKQLAKISSATTRKIEFEFIKWKKERIVQTAPQEIPQDVIAELKNPELLNNLIRELDKKVSGEAENKKAVIVIMCGGRLVENAVPTSSNLTINSASGSGKDHLISNALELLPKNLWEHKKRISAKALNYLHCKEQDPTWSWDTKILYTEDISSEIYNSDVFKVVSSSRGGVITTVEDGVAKNTTVIGKPVLVATSARLVMAQEMLRRFPLLNLDETEAATLQIVTEYAAHELAGGAPEYDPRLVQAQGCLKRVKVRVPFVDLMALALPSKNLNWRTAFKRWVDYVKFSAALHQYQRATDNEGWIVANELDYEIGTAVFKSTLQNVQGLPVTKRQKQFLTAIKSVTDQNKAATIKEVTALLPGISDQAVYKMLESLDSWVEGYLYDVESQTKSLKAFRIRSEWDSKVDLPLSYKALQKKVEKVEVVEVVEEIEQVERVEDVE